MTLLSILENSEPVEGVQTTNLFPCLNSFMILFWNCELLMNLMIFFLFFLSKVDI